MSFLHAYANSENERRARGVLEEVFPPASIVLTSEVLPEVKEFERTSAAVINAYVQPLIGRYLTTLQTRLAGEGFEHNVLVVQSNGALIASTIAARSAINTKWVSPSPI